MMKSVWAFLFFLVSLAASAQPVFFETDFGTPSNPEYSYSVKQLPSGTIYCAGYTGAGPFGGTDVFLAHFHRNGQLIWMKYYGDSLNDAALYINLTSDGNLILTGEKEIGPGNSDIGLWKVDTSGNLIWYNHYGGSLNQSAKYVRETADGGFLFCGFKNAGLGNDAYVVKTDASGNFGWDLALGGTDNDYAAKIVELPDGTFAVSYDTKQQGQYDLGLARFDISGSVMWDNVYGSQFQDGTQGLIVASDGNLVLYGEAEISTNSAFDFFQYKISPNGDSIWFKKFGGALADAMFSLQETSGGQMLGCGYSNSFANGPISVAVVNTDTSGNMNWVHVFGGGGIDIGYEIIPSIDGGWLGTGITTVGSDGQGYLLHLDNAGWAGTGEETKGEIKIYPNPGTGLYRLEMPAGCEKFTIRAYDLSGREVFSREEKGNSALVDLRENADGVYLVSVKMNGEISQLRLVKIPQ